MAPKPTPVARRLNSDEPNALAFCSDNYSFIGVAIPPVERLWQASVRVSPWDGNLVDISASRLFSFADPEVPFGDLNRLIIGPTFSRA